MPQFNNVGIESEPVTNHWFFVSLLVHCSCCSLRWLCAEPKVNHHYGLESNLTFSRWQRPFDNHAIQDNDYRCGGSGLCAGCPFLSQIPV